jgi:3'-phosphoadenosine 5'-phosphosulfate (PAPS) 3'-phosphatase
MLEAILDVLIRAMLRGAEQVLAVRRSGEIGASYKDATELVTVADKRSDAAIREVFETELRAIDPTIAFRLEESGASGEQGRHWVGADPLDGTNHFASGGASYSVQSHYIVDGAPQIGVVFQPEVYLPLYETENCVGRIAYAVRGEGAYYERTDFVRGEFLRGQARPLKMRRLPMTRNFVSCVPLSTKMSSEEWDRARKVLESGIVSSTTGVGGAGGNAMLTLFGGQHVYANLGAGEELDLAPPQVIAEEAGLTVWGVDRQSPVWNVRKQACVFAPSPEIAERFLAAAGL